MTKLLSFLFITFSLFGFSQNEELTIRVIDAETGTPVPNARIAFSGPKCILEKKTGSNGEVKLASFMNEDCFQKSTFYQIEVFGEEGIYLGTTKKFYSNNLVSNQTVTEVLKVKMIVKKASPEISFIPGSWEIFQSRSKDNIGYILSWAQDNPGLTIEIIGYYYSGQSTSLAFERARAVEKELLKRGLPKNQISATTALPAPAEDEILFEDEISLRREQFVRNDTFEVAVGFMISGMNEFFDDPCFRPDGKYGLNFSPGGHEMIETKCSSKKMLEALVRKYPGAKWKVVGINYDRENPKASKLANDRAQIVKDILMMEAVEEFNIQPSTEAVVKDEKSEQLKWPFLPEGTPYEIGVYIQKIE